MRRRIKASILVFLFCFFTGGCHTAETSATVSKIDSDSGVGFYDTLQEEDCPHTSGTFIQSGLCSQWDDDRWGNPAILPYT